MTLLTASDFLDTLQITGLLDATQLEELRHGPAAGTDPRNLARWLIDQGCLTAFQANQLLAGRGQNLVLGSYVLLERLGEGGMGQVFKARHVRLGRIAALKVIRRDRLTDPGAIRRFHREIQAVAQLSHPNIVLAYDADEVNGQHFFTMEYVEGVSLAQQVKEGGPLSVAAACEYTRQAALGLQHAFQRGMVHRDIKPSNLLLTWNTRPSGNGRTPMPGPIPKTGTGEVLVKILDMGLALLEMPETEDASETLTQKGILLGTPDFIAAEQASNPHTADIRSDLYSLGCTFYFLLTGKVPFPGGTAIDKLFRHRAEEPVPLVTFRPDIPETVVAVIRKLMAKLPQDRHQTPAELADDLYGVMHGLRRQGSASGILVAAAVEAAAAVETPDLSVQTPPTDLREPSKPVPPPARPKGGLRKYLVRAFRWQRNALILMGVSVGMFACALSLLFLGGSFSRPLPTSTETTPVSSAPALGRKYVLKGSREETVQATLWANGLPTLEGKWYIIGPFDNKDGKSGFAESYPPEREGFAVDKTYPGKGDKMISWKEFSAFKPGTVTNLRVFDDDDFSCCYLYHAFTTDEQVDLPVVLGFDDNGIVWLNGKLVYTKGPQPAWVHDHRFTNLPCNPGKNELLIKITNSHAAWEVYLLPTFPTQFESMFGARLKRDFPSLKPPAKASEPGKPNGPG